MSELRDFTHNAALASGFGTDLEYAVDDAELEPDEELEDDAVDEGEDAGQVTDAEYEQLSADFWSTLSEAEIARAERDPKFKALAWESFLNDQAVAEDDAGESIEQFADATEMVQAALSGEFDLGEDEDGRPVSPAQWLQWATSAPEADWIASCREAGLNPRIRPSVATVNQFGKDVQGEFQRESWNAHLARLREQGRYLGG